MLNFFVLQTQDDIHDMPDKSEKNKFISNKEKFIDGEIIEVNFTVHRYIIKNLNFLIFKPLLSNCLVIQWLNYSFHITIKIINNIRKSKTINNK